MAKAQERLMQAVAYAAQCLLITNDEYRGISQALAILGSVLEADMIRIFQYAEEEEQLRFEQRFEWSVDSLVCQIGDQVMGESTTETFYLPWEHELFQQLSIGKNVIYHQGDALPDINGGLEQLDLKQFIFVPILIDDAFWGYVELGSKDETRIWMIEEQAAMEMTATGIGGLLKRQSVQQALCKSRNELLAITSTLGEGLFVLDNEGKLTFINPVGEQLLGYSRQELIGRELHSVVHSHDPSGEPVELAQCPILEALRKSEVLRCEDDAFRVKSGVLMPVSYVLTPILEQNKQVGAVVVFRDMTEHKRAEEKLRMAAAVFENTAEGIIITDQAGKILSVNPAFAEITGYSFAEVYQLSPVILAANQEMTAAYHEMWQQLRQTGTWHGELKNRRPAGEEYMISLNVSAIRNQVGHTIQYVGIFSDITARKLYEEQIHYQAFHDVLTGLPNRRAFEQDLTQALLQQESFVLLLIDLDGFKEVNDLYGHRMGDLLLQQVSQRIQGVLPVRSKTFRLGGDEFTVVLFCTHLEEARQSITALLQVLQEPFLVYKLAVAVTSSIGVTRFPDDGTLAKALVEQADLAMYQAKDQGKNQYVFYHELDLKG